MFKKAKSEFVETLKQDSTTAIVYSIAGLALFVLALIFTTIEDTSFTALGTEYTLKYNIFEYRLGGGSFILILLAFALFLAVTYSLVFKYGSEATFRRFKAFSAYLTVLTPALIIYFFSIMPIATFDSGHYLSMTQIFEGLAGWEDWDIVRGFTFPVMLDISNLLFGKSVSGALTFLLINYYVFVCFISYLFFWFGFTLKKNPISVIAFTILVVLNPTIVGGFHVVLTEYASVVFAAVSCIAAYLWVKNPQGGRARTAALICFFVAMTVIAFQLKQPYIMCSLLPLLAAVVVGLIRKQGVQVLAMRCACFFACIAVAVASSALWHQHIARYAEINPSRTNSTIAGDTLLRGARLIRPSHITLPVAVANDFNRTVLNNSETKLLNRLIAAQDKTYMNSVLYNIHSFDDRHISYAILQKDTVDVTTADKLRFYVKLVTQQPDAILTSYYINLLQMSNVIAARDALYFTDGTQINYGEGFENAYLFTAPFKITTGWSNLIYSADRWAHTLGFLNAEHPTPSKIRYFNQMTTVLFASSSFKFVIFTLPIMFLFAFAWMVANRRKAFGADMVNKCDFIFILLFFSCGLVAFNVISGLFIDRYSFASYCLTFPVYVILILVLMRHFSLKVAAIENVGVETVEVGRYVQLEFDMAEAIEECEQEYTPLIIGSDIYKDFDFENFEEYEGQLASSDEDGEDTEETEDPAKDEDCEDDRAAEVTEADELAEADEADNSAEDDKPVKEEN